MTNEIEEGTVDGYGNPIVEELTEEQIKEKAENTEKMRAINAEVSGFIDSMDKKGMKLYVAGFHNDLDQFGIWKADSLSFLEEAGMSKVIGNQI